MVVWGGPCDTCNGVIFFFFPVVMFVAVSAYLAVWAVCSSVQCVAVCTISESLHCIAVYSWRQ